MERISAPSVSILSPQVASHSGQVWKWVAIPTDHDNACVPSDKVALAREAYDAFNRQDLGAVLERLDKAIQWRMHERFTRVPRVYEGHEGVREVFDAFNENFDEFKTEPDEFIEVGDRIVVPVTMRGLAKGSGGLLSYPCLEAA